MRALYKHDRFRIKIEVHFTFRDSSGDLLQFLVNHTSWFVCMVSNQYKRRDVVGHEWGIGDTIVE
jgi:hypothetical protein